MQAGILVPGALWVSFVAVGVEGCTVGRTAVGSCTLREHGAPVPAEFIKRKLGRANRVQPRFVTRARPVINHNKFFASV